MCFEPFECGKSIVKFRLKQGKTQQQISDKLNISLDHYRAIEVGRRVGSLDLAIEIDFVFGVSLDYLILGQDERPTLREEELQQLEENILADRGYQSADRLEANVDSEQGGERLVVL